LHAVDGRSEVFIFRINKSKNAKDKQKVSEIKNKCAKEKENRSKEKNRKNALFREFSCSRRKEKN
jgi:hypothetical protein